VGAVDLFFVLCLTRFSAQQFSCTKHCQTCSHAFIRLDLQRSECRQVAGSDLDQNTFALSCPWCGSSADMTRTLPVFAIDNADAFLGAGILCRACRRNWICADVTAPWKISTQTLPENNKQEQK
jgi:hypothetical protein